MVKARKEMIHLLDTIHLPSFLSSVDLPNFLSDVKKNKIPYMTNKDTIEDTDEEELSPSSGEWY